MVSRLHHGYLNEGIAVTDTQKVFIRNLRRTRDRLGLTQEQAAERVGITQKYLGAIELGYKFPSVTTLDKIGKALHVEVYQLFVDSPETENLTPAEVVDRYNEFLKEHAAGELESVRNAFLAGLAKARKETER